MIKMKNILEIPHGNNFSFLYTNLIGDEGSLWDLVGWLILGVARGLGNWSEAMNEIDFSLIWGSKCPSVCMSVHHLQGVIFNRLASNFNPMSSSKFSISIRFSPLFGQKGHFGTKIMKKKMYTKSKLLSCWLLNGPLISSLTFYMVKQV